MEVTINVVNAFIDGDKGGNPAGVVLEAQRFTREQKQAIAAQAGLPETAFVSPSDSAAFKLEFFTPNRQIPHCGHATIATFSLLRQQGLVSIGRTSKETIDGNRDKLSYPRQSRGFISVSPSKGQNLEAPEGATCPA